MKLRCTALFLLASLFACTLQAETYILPPPGVDIVGRNQVVKATYEDTLMDIARRYGLGYDEILQANPHVDRWIPGDGTLVKLPTRHILPDTPRKGIILNLPEKRLYYYPKPKRGETPVVMTYAIGVGRMNWETPLGTTKITTKVKGPSWRPPASIKAEHLQLYGEVLPDVVPAGPDNPLGAYAMRLGIPGYLIHGTNKRDGVGSRVSHGCIRLYPEGIEELFSKVPKGTPVNIINQPVKIGRLADTLFMEAHPPFEDERAPNQATFNEALRVINAKADGLFAATVDAEAVAQVIEQADGSVVALSN